jgi:signal transduction histidine kinase
MDRLAAAFPLRFLQRLRVPATAEETQPIEDAVAVARCLVAGSALLVAALDKVAVHGPLAQFLLAAYLVESLLVLLFLHYREPSPPLRFALHALDVACAVFVTVADESSGAVFFLLFVFVLLSAAFQWGFRETMWTALGGALFLLAEKVLVASISSGGRDLWGGTLEEQRLLVRLATLFAFGLLFGYLAHQEKELRAQTSRAKAMDRALVARELHDGAIQSLIGLEVQLEVLRRGVGDQSPLADDLMRVQKLLRHEILNLRELMQQMKPIDLSPHQLLDFLAESVDAFRRESGIAASFVSDLDEVDLAAPICQEVARIAREALVNIRKHSGAQNVVMRFEYSDRSWMLIVDDDGHGFDFSGRLSQAELDAARKGPVIIKERVRSIGGELTIESTKGRGARLEIRLPERRSGIRDRRAHGQAPSHPHPSGRRSSDRTRRAPQAPGDRS